MEQNSLTVEVTYVETIENIGDVIVGFKLSEVPEGLDSQYLNPYQIAEPHIAKQLHESGHYIKGYVCNPLVRREALIFVKNKGVDESVRMNVKYIKGEELEAVTQMKQHRRLVFNFPDLIQYMRPKRELVN